MLKFSTDSGAKIKILICGFIAVATLCTYWNVIHYGFNPMDDFNFTTDNKYVIKGITLDNIVWAFDFISGQEHKWYFHPLTWISHMLDCQFFGDDAGMHHLSNLIFHILNAVLLFLALQKMTGAVWKSAFVAMLFAVHPMNVESVAWIAERKNVLSTFFWMLTMQAYVLYAIQPNLRRYLLVILVLMLGLLSKPMLLTLPCALLLLDAWPLGRLAIFATHEAQFHLNGAPRFQPGTAGRLLMEKIPLLLVSFVFLVISLWSLHRGQAEMVTTEVMPISYRLASAPIGYLKYISKLIWPRDLAIFYPMPFKIVLGDAILSIIVLLILTAGAIMTFQKRPYLLIGWLWFLGTLFPVIGMVRSGLWPEIADRWAYIPAIGLFIVFVWGGSAVLEFLPGRKVLAPAAAAVVSIVLMIACHQQVGYWSSTKKLFQHAHDVTKDNFVANYILGINFFEENKFNEAIEYLERSTARKLPATTAYGILCEAYVKADMLDRAVFCYEVALKEEPEKTDFLNALGDTLVKQNKLDAALACYNRALETEPKSLDVLNNIGNVFIIKKEYETALKYFNQLLAAQPDHGEAHINAGVALAHLNRIDPAIAHYHKAIRFAPENAELYNNLGALMAKKNLLAEAEAYFQEALRLRPDYVSARENLAKLQPFLK